MCSAPHRAQFSYMEYVVSPTGPLGFQVSTVGEGENRVVADFASQAEAEAFVSSMRRIDGGRTHSMNDPEEQP